LTAPTQSEPLFVADFEKYRQNKKYTGISILLKAILADSFYNIPLEQLTFELKSRLLFSSPGSLLSFR
jgi:hypothetical protein